MSVNWKGLSRAAGLTVIDGVIRVQLPAQRQHLVRVETETPEALRLWAVVAKPAVVTAASDGHLRAWRRNRLTEIVGFFIDGRGRMIGEAWIPTAGLDAAEWGFIVRYVAKVCDGFERHLTAKDVE